MSKKQKRTLIRIIISAVLFAVIFLAEKIIGEPMEKIYILFPLYLIPYLISGYDVLIGCGNNIIHGKFLDEEFLMTVATVGAFALSIFSPEHNEYAEAVFVMIFYQTGELFQSIAVGKTRKSISDLMDISPDTAVILRDGEETEVVPEEIEIGDILVVRPGEKIAVDGTVVYGESEIDTSALTGESVPAEVKAGDSVISGCINLGAMIKLRCDKEYGDSTVAKILELIENSSLHKAKTELFLTKFARVYTPTVVGIAAALALLGSVITRSPASWISRALIFLVVSCPCAIVISVPMAYFGGIGGASRKGILIKGSDGLEALSSARTFVFDKTGTLTNGKFSVTGVYPEDGITEDELLRLTATAEYYSVHPVGLSIKEACNGGALIPDDCENIPGRGIRSTIGNREILAGNAELLKETGITAELQSESGTVVYVAANGKYYGHITLEDTPRQTAKACITGLKKSGIKRFAMLTGDNREKAEKIGQALGINDIFASLLPADKVNITEKICNEEAKGEKTVFVGDGINDAPVLARADIGIAMGGIGSDAAIEAADIVIMNDDIGKLPTAMSISVMTKKIIRQNIIFALGVKIAVLILASFGLTNLWAGVFADVGVAVLCILNSMRTLNFKEKNR